MIDGDDSETERVFHWLLQVALPWWSENGFDGSVGLAHEEFTFEGTPKETGYRRTVVQFRQVYALTHAALLGCCSPDVPVSLFERVCACAWLEEGGWAHSLEPRGTVLDRTRDLYDQAFALLACALVYGLTRKPAVLMWVERTLNFLDVQMASASGGYVESLPPRLPRRQNPHMHLFEALLTLYEVTRSPLYLTRANRLHALLLSRFITPQLGEQNDTFALCEYFGPSWEVSQGGVRVEPGHHFEWVWLLHEHARLANFSSELVSSQLFRFAVRHGLDGQGLAIEEVDTTGRPLLRSVKLWALCEQLKALVARAEAENRNQDPGVGPLVRNMFTLFLDHPRAPVWFEGRGEDGSPDRRRMPSSTLYHLTSSFMELLRWRGLLPRMLSRMSGHD